MTSKTAKAVVFVTYPGVKLLDLTGPLQVFSDAALHHGSGYDVEVVSQSGGMVRSDTPMPVATLPFADVADSIDTLIIAGGGGVFDAVKDAHFLDGIRALAARSRRIGSICTGAFALAHAGLLSGRRAVTHWDSCDLLRETFADIIVEDDAIFVRDGHIWTSAGVTSGIDMSLAMVADDIGRGPALALARNLVCYMVRPGGQSQFSTSLQHQLESATGRFETLNAWITDNLSAPLTVEDLADKAMMSPRNFARLYRSETGITPAKAVERMRVEAACRLLEESDLPLATIASRCGFHDDERFRRAFARARNIAPGEYRQRFGHAN